jgi:hypothetical protein
VPVPVPLNVPALVVVGDNVALDATSLIAQSCETFVCVEDVQKEQKCTRAEALCAWTFQSHIRVVVDEVEDSLGRFLHEQPGEGDTWQWHFALEPRACRLSVQLGEMDSGELANPDAMSNITILCHKKIREWIGGISLSLDGHVSDWAIQDASQPDDDRVLSFPLYSARAPLLVRWIKPDSELRVVVHLCAPPRARDSPEHISFAADVAFFDTGALDQLLLRTRNALDTSINTWVCDGGRQPLLLMQSCSCSSVPSSQSLRAHTLLSVNSFLSEVPGHLSLLQDAQDAQDTQENPDPSDEPELDQQELYEQEDVCVQTNEEVQFQEPQDDEEQRASLLWDQAVALSDAEEQRRGLYDSNTFPFSFGSSSYVSAPRSAPRSSPSKTAVIARELARDDLRHVLALLNTQNL